jgi:hypothetical protein
MSGFPVMPTKVRKKNYTLCFLLIKKVNRHNRQALLTLKRNKRHRDKSLWRLLL